MKKLLSSLLAACLTLSLAVLPVSALTLEEAKELLQQHYVDGIPQEVLELDSLDAVLEALGDPYTVYMPADVYEDFISSVNGQVVVGIGATVENAFHDGYRIMSILPDSPALEAGLLAGDLLVAVDGVELTAATDPRTHIVGEEGTSLTVTVLRDGARLDFTLVRRAVTIPIVTYELVDGAARIDCISFGDTTTETISQAIEELDESTAVWLVDLRANPGGDSNATATSASLFIGGGIMLYFRDGQGNYNYTYTLPSFPDLTDKPVIVLTSPNSASGAELFSSDIRDHGAGIAVGQRTFGKGIAQIVLDETNCDAMEGGEALKITAYRFFSPDGATNHIIGVLPTLVISPENTQAAALLLSQPEPDRAAGYLKLVLAGQTFYLRLSDAEQPDRTAAFTELLEALPPSAALYKGSGSGTWTAISPAQLAAEQGLPFHTRSFTDIAGDEFEREIATLAAYGLLGGYENGTFHPKDTITRAEFCAMVASALDLPAREETSFSDVSSSAWYADAVSAMADMGFIAGYGDGTFGPEDTISYQQMAAVLSSVAAWASMDGYELAQQELPIQDYAKYMDYAPWAQTAARNLDKLGALVGGLLPTDSGTRSVAAGMLCRLMETIHLIWD